MDTRRRRSVVTSLLVGLCVAVAGCDGAASSAGDEVATAETPVDEAAEEAASSGQESPPAQEPASPEVGDSPQVPPLLEAIDDLDETIVTIGDDEGAEVRVDAKVAATTVERRHGLMFVPDLPDGVGMLFVFDETRSGGFWMRNTLVPLDIAYIDADGIIVAILAMEPCEAAEASDCPTYTPEKPYRYALEVPQGWFAEVGVAEGDTVAWTEPEPPR